MLSRAGSLRRWASSGGKPPPGSGVGSPLAPPSGKPYRSTDWFGKNDKDGFIYRSGMKNQGLPDDVFDGRPVIGIANTFSEFTPCNAHFREIAARVKRGVWEAGGVPFGERRGGVQRSVAVDSQPPAAPANACQRPAPAPSRARRVPGAVDGRNADAADGHAVPQPAGHGRGRDDPREPHGRRRLARRCAQPRIRAAAAAEDAAARRRPRRPPRARPPRRVRPLALPQAATRRLPGC